MRKPVLVTAILLLLLIFAGSISAVFILWTKESFEFEQDSYYIHRVMNNTADDYFTVFYSPIWSTPKPMRARLVSYDGDYFGPEQTLLSDRSGYKLGGIVWHPKAKRYMFAFGQDDKILVMAMYFNGAPMIQPQIIATGATPNVTPQVAWARNGKFIIFYQKDNQIWAQAVKKTCVKFKDPKQLTAFKKGVAIPSDASTEKDGTAVCYYSWLKSSSASKFKPYMIKANHKLAIALDKRLAGPQPYQQYHGLCGAYDPVSGTHALTSGATYALFDKDGIAVTPAAYPFATIPNCSSIFRIVYDPYFARFVGFHTEIYFENYIESAYIYATIIDTDGTIETSAWELGGLQDEYESFGGGVNKGGNILGLISFEGYPQSGGWGSGPTMGYLLRHY